MMHKGRIVGLAALALIMLLIGLACASGNNAGSAANPSPGPGGGLTACQALDGLKRYRYTFNFRLLSPQPETPVDETLVGVPGFAMPPNNPTFELAQDYEGSVVNPDRIQMLVRNPGTPELQLLFIGDEAWNLLDGRWLKAARAVSIPFVPARVCGAMLTAPDFASVVPVEEELNGRATSHYRFDSVEAQTAAALLGGESDMGRLLTVYELDVWLTADGWPAKITTRSEGTYPSGRKLSIEMGMEVKDPDAGDIVIEPPAA